MTPEICAYPGCGKSLTLFGSGVATRYRDGKVVLVCKEHLPLKEKLSVETIRESIERKRGKYEAN